MDLTGSGPSLSETDASLSGGLSMDRIEKAQKLGKDAFNRGDAREKNPFDPGSRSFYAWQKGWDLAHNKALCA